MHGTLVLPNKRDRCTGNEPCPPLWCRVPRRIRADQACYWQAATPTGPRLFWSLSATVQIEQNISTYSPCENDCGAAQSEAQVPRPWEQSLRQSRLYDQKYTDLISQLSAAAVVTFAGNGCGWIQYCLPLTTQLVHSRTNRLEPVDSCNLRAG